MLDPYLSFYYHENISMPLYQIFEFYSSICTFTFLSPIISTLPPFFNISTTLTYTYIYKIIHLPITVYIILIFHFSSIWLIFFCHFSPLLIQLAFFVSHHPINSIHNNIYSRLSTDTLHILYLYTLHLYP